jgi:hypothetical protein
MSINYAHQLRLMCGQPGCECVLHGAAAEIERLAQLDKVNTNLLKNWVRVYRTAKPEDVDALRAALREAWDYLEKMRHPNGERMMLSPQAVAHVVGIIEAPLTRAALDGGEDEST